MPSYTGSAAPGAPERVLHRHRFFGAETLGGDEGLSAEHLAEVQALLRGAVSLELSVSNEGVLRTQNLEVVVTVRNQIGAHSFPTGSTFNRQAWLWLEARDSQGIVIYQTGDLDSNGDLKNIFSEEAPFADKELVSFSSELIDLHVCVRT